MTAAPDSSISVATNISDDDTPAGSGDSSQRLTRAQFEAAMRVMDAHAVSRPAAASPEDSPVTRPH